MTLDTCVLRDKITGWEKFSCCAEGFLGQCEFAPKSALWDRWLTNGTRDPKVRMKLGSPRKS